MEEKTKCLIIGSGPAGYTAGIYTSRANLHPILYEGLQVGGQLTITTEVENFPGFPEGVQGTDLMEHIRQQALKIGTDIRSVPSTAPLTTARLLLPTRLLWQQELLPVG